MDCPIDGTCLSLTGYQSGTMIPSASDDQPEIYDPHDYDEPPVDTLSVQVCGFVTPSCSIAEAFLVPSPKDVSSYLATAHNHGLARASVQFKL